MVVYNASTRELTAKIVYYGPGLGGKTTNLNLLHDRLDPQTVGKLLNLAAQSDRTIYFDLLPVELGDIKGYKIRFQLATVPGQTAFNETRRVVLRGADGIVFVADSQWSSLPKNLESWQNLKENLKTNGTAFEGIPVVIQYNKRDLTDILSVDALQEALGLSSYPFVEAVASAGRGVTETFKLISKLTFVDLLRRLQGRKPEDEAAPVRTDHDDILSWKESMLHRGTPPAMAPAKPRLSIVPPAADEAPFEAADLSRLNEEEIEIEGPLTDTAKWAAPAPLEATAQVFASETVRLVLPKDAAKRPAVAAPDAARAAAAAFMQNTSETTKIPVLGPEPGVRELEAKVKTLETLLAEAVAGLDADRALLEGGARVQTELESRLAKLETAVQSEPAAEARVKAVEDRLEAEAKRQRVAEDDVGLALGSLSERGERLHQSLAGYAAQTQEFAAAIAALAGRMEALEKALQEKTSQARREADDIRSQIETLQTGLDEKLAQGRREAEDIRAQIAPVLEAESKREAAEKAMPAEFDRLRESLAESLADLSERLRRAVSGR